MNRGGVNYRGAADAGSLCLNQHHKTPPGCRCQSALNRCLRDSWTWFISTPPFIWDEIERLKSEHLPLDLKLSWKREEFTDMMEYTLKHIWCFRKLVRWRQCVIGVYFVFLYFLYCVLLILKGVVEFMIIDSYELNHSKWFKVWNDSLTESVRQHSSAVTGFGSLQTLCVIGCRKWCHVRFVLEYQDHDPRNEHHTESILQWKTAPWSWLCLHTLCLEMLRFPCCNIWDVWWCPWTTSTVICLLAVIQKCEVY